MAVSIQLLNDEEGPRYVFGNDDGTWAVWAEHSTLPDGRVVGPGYVGRVRMRRDGDLLCEGFVEHAYSMNDPRWQGIGGIGWHHFRDLPDEPNIWNKGWDMCAHRAGDPADPFGVTDCRVLVDPYVNTAGEARASFEVDFRDRYSNMQGKRVMSVRYDYIFDASQMKMWITLTPLPDGLDAGPGVFVKEPKICVGLCPPGDEARLRWLDLYRADGSVLRENVDLDAVGDPGVNTLQIGFDTRARARFLDANEKFYVNVVARASQRPSYDPVTQRPLNYGTRADWEGADFGLDQWAVRSNARARYADSPCSAYCLQGPGGTLTRQWEVAKDPTKPGVELMLHSWEGGSGLPDCLCCARSFAIGESYTTFLSVSRDAGWQV